MTYEEMVKELSKQLIEKRTVNFSALEKETYKQAIDEAANPYELLTILLIAGGDDKNRR